MNVDVYYRVGNNPIWGVSRVPDVKDMEEAFKLVEEDLIEDNVVFHKPFFGFIKGGKYGG